MRYSLNKDVLQRLLDYLSTRPFKEVSALIDSVMKDAKAVVEENTGKQTEVQEKSQTNAQEANPSN